MTRIAPDWLTEAAPQTVMAALVPAKPLFVGGCVRDALMGRDSLDIDIAVITPPDQTMALVESVGLKVIPTGLDHGVVTVIVDGVPFEVATLRRDVATDGRRAVVAFTDRIEEDAERRDFTMNALYADAAGEVIDPLGEGVSDLSGRRIRFIGDAGQRLREDYLRILRFFRFHAQFGIAPLEAEGLAACLAERSRLNLISAERIGAEMRKLLASQNPGPALEAMGPILTQILPGAVWSEALLDAEAALGLSPQPMRRLASLNAASVERLRLSNAEQSHLKKVGLARNLAVHEVAYRFGEDVALDSVAIDLVVDRPPAALREEIGQSAATTFPVMAKDLMDLGMKPGPELGATLKELEAQWIAKRFAPSRETLLSSLLLGS